MVSRTFNLWPGLKANCPVEAICISAERTQGQQAKAAFGSCNNRLDKLFTNPLVSPGRKHIQMAHSANIRV